jgi:metal-responsive CopG/Arc/MetJ family transcriptional regulator
MNADHKLGRSEAIRDAVEMCTEELKTINGRIAARSIELSNDSEYKGLVYDDPKLNDLIGIRVTLEMMHGKLARL